MQVALPVPLPRLFDYRLDPPFDPGTLVGRRVRVPFGPHVRIGVIAGIGHDSTLPSPLKPVLELIDADPVFDADLWRSLAWASSYYHHPLGEILHAALPGALRRGAAPAATDEPGLAITAAGLRAHAEQSLRPGAGRAVLARLSEGPLPLGLLREELGEAGTAAARRLVKRGWLQRLSLAPTDRPRPILQGPPLNHEQQAAVEAIGIGTPGYRAVLLDGVTGSGKTEVYLRLIEQVLAAGRKALVLVPEIALTPQALRRYRERLDAPVLALHSGLSDGERARAWSRARLRNRPCVLIGTRSAVFSPLPDAGLIVVDEEHDSSYKQGDGFRYQARDLALVRAKHLDVPIVLGTATPSLEMLALANEGRALRLRLHERGVLLARPPELRLIDVRRQPLVGGLAPMALASVAATLQRGEQVLVFRNRRGYAPLLGCPQCGWHSECPRCDKSMTLHRSLGVMLCHHCGLRRRVPAHCPDCGHDALDARGIGTERIEGELAERFPGHRVLRVDRDNTRGTGQLDRALSEIGRGEPAILVGTQLLAKGHDWPSLTLVAITDADHGLFSPDFRAPERLAQLLSQVAGRAGRGDRAGAVLIQTRQPEHPFWPRWLGGGYEAVAQAELAERQLAALPPFRHQALLAAEALQERDLDAFFQAALELPEARHPQVDALGPMPAPMPRRAGHHRRHLLLESGDRAPLHHLLSAWLPRLYPIKAARRVRWSLDVDPHDLY